jgi:histidinol-phosphate/aromatic aminotransferase/cobyric acid decarboxylase-like protein
VGLDLRYAPDEAELLDPNPARLWEELVISLPNLGAEVVGGYAVDDPYGAERGAPAVTEHFGCLVEPARLTFGAGVTSLLHALAGLAQSGPVAAPEAVHPDLEVWAAQRGADVHLLDGAADRDRLIAFTAQVRPAVLHLDRPAFSGEPIALRDLETVASRAARLGTVVLVDESPAPYLGPSGSAVRLTDRLDNLVVLRGFTKAYSWGGLRAGFAVASLGVAARVRELVPPMQIGELALLGALRLLSAGDVFRRLRARVRAIKPEVVRVLRAAGMDVLEGHEDIPWVVVLDPGGATSELLAARGIAGLRPAPATVPSPRGSGLLHLTIPLSDGRMRELTRRLEARP